MVTHLQKNLKADITIERGGYRMKKWIRGIIVCLLGVIVLGGCQQPLPKITKEQQNNIAMQILRYYDIQEIEFTQFARNTTTGHYYLSLKINNNDLSLYFVQIE